MDIKNFITPAAIAAYWTDASANRTSLGAGGLFGYKKKAGLKLAMIKGSRGLPVSLMPSAFDAKATFRDHVGFDRIETTMPFFREGYHLDEEFRQQLLEIENQNSPLLDEIMDRIFDDVTDLINGANVVPERMAMQLLFPTEGAVGFTIKANGVDYTYNYDPDGTWKANNYIALTSGDMWTAPDSADPIQSLIIGKNKAKSLTGVTSKYAVMNSNTFNLAATTESVKNRYLSAGGISVGYITPEEAKRVIEATTKLTIVSYDEMYRDESKKSHMFVPDNYVSLIPDGELGKIWYGVTPEEADLRSGNNAEVSIVNTGVAITKVITPHPVNVNIYASQIVMPSFERMDDVISMKVG